MKDISILEANGINLKKSLELFGDMATYDQMLEDFLKEIDNKILKSKKFKEDGDMANYAIIVHSLKSDCRYFGIDALADEFYEHELAGKRNDYIFVTSNYDKLISDTNKIVNILKRYMGVEVEDKTLADNTIASKNGMILVVDDSNIIRNFIEKIFNDKYDIRLASDGEEAISIIANTPHSNLMCVFLDLNMPNVDGFQVLEYFKRNNLFSKVPVSIITGIDDKDTIERAFSYPIVDVINKPFNEASIKNVALKTIAKKQS